MKTQDLGKTQISDNIRVSSAAIFYEAWFGNYFQVETWIFSENPLIKSKQIIHGTCNEYLNYKLVAKCEKVHDYISNNLIAKLAL